MQTRPHPTLLFLFRTCLLLMGFPIITASAQVVEAEVETRRVVAEFQHYLDETLRHYAPGMAVAIVDGRSTSYISTWGNRRLGEPDIVDPHTTFRLASLSKAFAAATAGILIQEGALTWDDKLVALLPGLTLKDSQRQSLISVRHILSNSTGLFPHAYTNLVEDNVPWNRILEKMGEVDFVCDPGDCYTYQNVAYSFIGDILKNVTGREYTALVEEKLFAPLEMTDASVTLEAFIGGNHASPHERRRRQLVATDVKPSYYTVAPAAGVNASITDMERWLQALLGGRPDILPPEVLGELFTPGARVRERSYYSGPWSKVKGTWYGLGWRVFDYAGTQVIYHGGWVQGYHAEIVIVPSLSLGMALLMNSDYTNGEQAVPRFLDIALGLNGGAGAKLVSE